MGAKDKTKIEKNRTSTHNTSDETNVFEVEVHLLGKCAHR